MYIITRKAEDCDFDLFYRFSSDETDLYCVASDDIESCKKYSESEKKRLEYSELLQIRGCRFRKVGLVLL